MDFCIRKTKREDCAAVFELVKDLANYEKQPPGHGPPKISPADFEEHGFGPEHLFEVIVAEDTTTHQLLGYALFYDIYCTVDGRGLLLEDIYVKANQRGRGLGFALMNEVVKIAAEKKCSRVDLHVLHWNESSIQFYKKKFGAINVTETKGFHIYRLNQESINKCI